MIRFDDLAANIDSPAGFAIYLDALLESGLDVELSELGVELAAPWRNGRQQGPGDHAAFLRTLLRSMVQIPAGTYIQGTPGPERTRENERPRRVTITRPFLLGRTPVKQALWEHVMGSNPSHHKGPDLPVERVSWHDCHAFCQRLERLAPGFGWRLPSEAQWEYAARAGTTGERYGPIDEIAWYHGNSDSRTHPVGMKAPNAWGLYDMIGNVWEWCLDGADSWQPAPYPPGHAVDPVGGVGPFARTTSPGAEPGTATKEARDQPGVSPAGAMDTSGSAWPQVEGPRRVFRGGSWGGSARSVRAACRYASTPGGRSDNLGFRLAGGPLG